MVREVFVVLLGLGWTMSAVAMIARLRFFGIEGQLRVAVQAIALFLVVLPVVAFRSRRAAIGLKVGNVSLQIAVAAVAFGAVVWIATHRPGLLASSAIFVPAACEELVFRLMLPWFISEGMRRAGMTATHSVVTGCLTAQVTFALSHAVNAPLAHDELVRLCAAGLLFAELVRLFGLWFAAAVHASMNYLLITQSAASHQPGSLFLLLACVVGLALLLTRGTSLTAWLMTRRPGLRGALL
ncbi:MAG: CPBP family glutamic-type intramembrane protease [Gemmatimonadaceae bacterium]